MAVVTYFHLSPPFFIFAAEARQRQKMNKQTVADSEVITENYTERGKKGFLSTCQYVFSGHLCVCVCVCWEQPKMANITILIIISFSSSSRAPLIQFVFFCPRQTSFFISAFESCFAKNVARQIRNKTFFWSFSNDDKKIIKCKQYVLVTPAN